MAVACCDARLLLRKAATRMASQLAGCAMRRGGGGGRPPRRRRRARRWQVAELFLLVLPRHNKYYRLRRVSCSPPQ
jgi:hypothetical protein